MALDAGWARARFPALATDWALMDNAGGSVPLGAVIERIADYMRTRMVQLGASYPLSVEAREAVRAGRAAAAELINADVDEVVLGTNTTVNVRLLASALAPAWRPGDEVIVTNLDHEANIGPWRALESQGIRVREWRFDPDSLRLRVRDLEPLLTERTRLVAFTHCSNLIGTVHDAPRICALVRAAGALSCVDGVAFAPHRRVDVREIGADFYLVSLYKTYGPHIGMLFGRRELLAGAVSQNHFFVEPEAGPYRFEPGNANHELTASLTSIPDYLRDLARNSGGVGSLASAFESIAEHESAIVQPLLDYLARNPRVRLLGDATASPARVPTVSFTVEGHRSSALTAAIDAHRVAIRHGHFYAYRAARDLDTLATDGVVRASLVHYNTAEEVDRLIRALDATIGRKGNGSP